METEGTLSLKLYDYLCEVVGSEKTVFARRLWYNIKDDCNKTIIDSTSDNPFVPISSGSRAEGLDFNGSDLDMMFVLGTMVDNHTNSSSNAHLLCYDMETSQPGFCKIKICPTLVNKDPSNVFRKFGVHSNLFLEAAVCIDKDICVSCDKFKRHFLSGRTRNYEIFDRSVLKLHGPCLSRFDDSLDMAFCLKCPLWPSQASTLITRHKLSDWPSADILSKIVHAGVLFVPIGTSSEWRISFSVGEKLLIHSLNHTQLLCYALLKYVLKEVISDVPDLQNLLCSYFMKTVVFWVLEENDVKYWTPQRLLPCFQQCLKRLLYFIQCGYCPNYFMPDNNMFRNKIYGKYQIELYSFLSDLYNGGMLYVVLCCNSLFGFHNNMTFMTDIEQTDRGVYPLLPNSMNIHNSGFQFNFVSPILTRFMRLCFVKKCVPKLAIDLYLIELARIIGKATCQCICYNHGMRNRKVYIAYRNWRYQLFIGAACDNVRGWLYVAMFFYCHRQFDHALRIINFVLSECTNDKYYLQRSGNCKLRPVSVKVKDLPFAKRLKLTCVHDNLQIGGETRNTFLLPLLKELFADHDQIIDKIASKIGLRGASVFLMATKRGQALAGGIVLFPSTSIFALYIRFMCNHHLHNYEESQCSLYSLKDAVEHSNSNDCFIHFSSYILLERAIAIADSDIDTTRVYVESTRKWLYALNQKLLSLRKLFYK